MPGAFHHEGTTGASSTVTPTQDSSLLENELRAVNRSEESALVPAGGGYFAVVERSPEVVFGVSSAREEEGSLHVVIGKW